MRSQVADMPTCSWIWLQVSELESSWELVQAVGGVLDGGFLGILLAFHPTQSWSSLWCYHFPTLPHSLWNRGLILLRAVPSKTPPGGSLKRSLLTCLLVIFLGQVGFVRPPFLPASASSPTLACEDCSEWGPVAWSVISKAVSWGDVRETESREGRCRSSCEPSNSSTSFWNLRSWNSFLKEIRDFSNESAVPATIAFAFGPSRTSVFTLSGEIHSCVAS